MAVVEKPGDNMDVVRLSGGFIVAGCVLMGAIVLFILPASCSFVAGGMLLVASLGVIVGIVVFVLGHFKSRKNRLFRSK